MQVITVKSIRDRLLESLYTTPRSLVLHELLRSGAKLYVLGGAVRDAIASDLGCEDHKTPRDFDIGVSGVKPEVFAYILSAFGVKNRHDGFVLKELGQPTWDMWRLEASVGLRRTGVAYSLENVLRTFNLDCNAVCLNILTGALTDAGAIRAIRLKQVGFVSDRIQHSSNTFAAKALLLHLRFGYSLAADVQQSIQKYLVMQTLRYECSKIFPHVAGEPETTLVA